MAHPQIQPDPSPPAGVLKPRAPALPWALLAAAVCGVVLLWQMPDANVGVFYDDGIYAALAKALAEGHGYHLMYLPGTPGAVHYPFGYPAFLALLWTLWPHFPANVLLLRDANAFLMAAFAGLLVPYLARMSPERPWLAALGAVLAVTAIPLVAVATVLFSEPLYLVIAVAACIAGDAATRAEGRRGLVLAVVAGALAGLAGLTRSIGVSAVAGVVIALLVAKRRTGAAAALGTAVVVLLPWLLWTRAHQHDLDPALISNYGTYGQFMAQGGLSWLDLNGLFAFFWPLASLLMPHMPLLPLALLAIPVVFAFATGGRELLRRTPSAGWMMAVYLAIVAVWPYDPDRFAWAALPWLFGAFVAGVAVLVTHAGADARLMRAVGWAAAAIVAAGMVPRQVAGLARGDATATQRAISHTFDVIVPWIRSDTDSSAVIAGEDEALLWLYTGRRAVPSYLWRVRGRTSESSGPDELHRFLLRSGATHLILTGPGSDAAATINELLGRAPGFLYPVRAWPGPMMAFAIRPQPGDAAVRPGGRR